MITAVICDRLRECLSFNEASRRPTACDNPAQANGLGMHHQMFSALQGRHKKPLKPLRRLLSNRTPSAAVTFEFPLPRLTLAS
jgi:hypothetical protein